MGIKNLNQYLLKQCSQNSILKIKLETLQNKVIVVDTSIYLYKFLVEGALMENIYFMISLFQYYKITPIFIFDGKPPPEKWELLKKRNWEKKEAEQKYILLKNSMEEDDSAAIAEMEILKRKMIRLKNSDIQKVKELMDAFGVLHYEAPGEADQLCVYIVNSGIGWACMSDDMDMFLYGCNRLLRNLSLLNRHVVLYNTESILKDLDLNIRDFLEIMVLSGTDYNINGEFTLRKTLEWYKQYKCEQLPKLITQSGEDIKEDNNSTPFYGWLLQKSNINNTELISICDMFNMNEILSKLQGFDEIYKTYLENLKKPNLKKIQEIMENEGFIFV